MQIASFEDLIGITTIEDLESIPEELLTLKIKIHGDQFHGSLTGSVARAIGELQTGLYRAAAEILHGDPNVAKLTADEKTRFELVILVQPGCSEFLISGKDYLLPLIKETVKKMESGHIAIVACVAIVAFTASPVAMKWFEVQAQSASNAALVEQAKVLVAPLQKTIEMQGAYIAKSAHSASSVEIGGNKFSRDDIVRLNAKTRGELVTDTFEGDFVVVGVRFENGILKLDLCDISTGEKFSANMPPKGLFEDDLPEKAKDVADLMDTRKPVRAVIFVKESKSKSERLVTSWAPSEDTGTVVPLTQQ